MNDQIIISIILGLTLVFFIQGRWRYDFVAVVALIASVLTGLVDPKAAFLGFGHPAVVTVGAVLAISTALQNAGVADILHHLLIRAGNRFWVQLALLNLLIALISGFMNNIGALAILLPVTIQMAKRAERFPSQYLMPVAFSSLLGGMVTLIGTPPNIIVAMMREEALGESFKMFDFAPVGIGVAVFGIFFLSVFGWRLLPKRKGKSLKEDLFEIESYITELKVTKKLGLSIKEFESSVEGDLTVLGIVRKQGKINSPSMYEPVKKGDVLIVEAESETLSQLDGCEILSDTELKHEILGSQEITVMEAVVRSDSSLIGKTLGKLRLRWRYGINLLAVSRLGKRIKKRLSQIQLQPGDVLLIRGPELSIMETITQLGCLPLQYRGLNIGEPKGMFLALAIFGLAIFLSAVGYLSIQIAFVSVVVLLHLFGLLRLREIYESIDWPIIILLGALIPVGQALETTGAAQNIANGILYLGGGLSPTAVLATVLIGTMFLSDLVNNATAAVLMVPIALSIASGLEVSPDPFLMAVAIGASCPFLTPIGHQCNAIILGPGGYHFGDYWRVGLILEVIIVLVSIPLLRIFWPF